MDIQKEREAFLAHMRSIGSARFMFELDEDGDFDDMSMAYAWSAWQAAKSQSVPEGFVLVPKKSTDWQRVNVRDMDPDIEDYENMSKMDWENLCGEIYERMVEVGPE